RFFSRTLRATRSLLFPYTTLFRSGSGELLDRISEHDQQLAVPVDRLMRVLDWLAAELHRFCAAVFPMPDGESLTFSLVTNQPTRSEEHTSELQSRRDLVCRLLLEK